jgi:hypothetical protein
MGYMRHNFGLRCPIVNLHLHFQTQMFENVARRLLDMHHSSRDRKREDERKEKEKERGEEEEGGEDVLTLLNQRLLEAQQKLSESEGRNGALKEELQEMVRLLEEERERRIAAEHRLAELEALMMGHRNEHSMVHIGGRDKRRETLLQCYASSGFPTNKAKSLDGSDDMELSGVHLAVDMMMHWLFKTIQRCENMFSLASSKLFSSLPGDDRI